MTETTELIALMRKLLVIAGAIDNRLGRIERGLVPPVYKVAEDGVLTRITTPSQITEGSTSAGQHWNVTPIPIRGPR